MVEDLTPAQDHFNYLVTHNAMKWSSCERKQGVLTYEAADGKDFAWFSTYLLLMLPTAGAVAWAEANSLPMRGHALLWATGHRTTYPAKTKKLTET